MKDKIGSKRKEIEKARTQFEADTEEEIIDPENANEFLARLNRDYIANAKEEYEKENTRLQINHTIDKETWD